MAFPLIPILAIAAVAVFAGAGGKKKTKTQRGPTPGPTPGPVPGPEGGWLSSGDSCNPLDPSNVPPGYGCFEASDGKFYVVDEYDVAKAPTLEFGEFGDAQGVREALMLLGFGFATEQQNIARFQEYSYTYFDLPEGDLRFDGRLDNKTIVFLSQAIADYEDGSWVSEEEYLTEQSMLDFEYDNAATFVSAWVQDPLLGWEFPDGEFVMPAEGGQTVSSWLTSAVYWGTYNVGGSQEPGASMPKTFWPVPYTEQWEAETAARNVWLRIQEYVKLNMEELGVPDDTIYPENENS